MAAQTLRPSYFAFGLTGFSAAAFGVLLALFILKPSLPATLHAALSGHSGPSAAPPMVATNSTPTQQVHDLSPSLINGSANDRALAEQEGSYDPSSAYLQKLLRNELPEQDQAFINTWQRRQFASSPQEAKAIGPESIYAVRRYELNNGQKVLVYTQIDTETGQPDVSKQVNYNESF